MAYTTRLSWETLRSRNSTSMLGTYQTLGDPLVHASFICKLVNNSTQLVTISIDGVNDIDVAPAGSFWLYDEHLGGVPGSALPIGTQLYVKGTAGTGFVYLVSQYIVTV